MLGRVALLCLILSAARVVAQVRVNSDNVHTEVVATGPKLLRSTPTSQQIGTSQSQAAFTNDGLSIGAVNLRLGMAKDAALAELAKRYDLRRLYSHLPDSSPLPDDWQVQEKGHKSPADKIIGQVRFRSGKLTIATKEWTPEDKEYLGTDAADMIYRIVLQFEEKGSVNCTIRTLSSLQQPGPGSLEFRETEVNCGHRQIEIMLTWQSDSRWVQVSESVRGEPETP